MDAVDQATETDFTAAALAAHKARQPHASGPAAQYCCECGEPIPEARQQAAAGTRHCTDCQRALELQSSRRGAR